MNKFSWGMPTLIELNTIEENIALCQKLKLDFVEINMNLPQFQANAIDCVHFNTLKDSTGIMYTIHLPEEFDIANFSSEIRNSYNKIFMETVRVAKELVVPIINMHLNVGVYFTLPDRKIYLYEKYKDEYIRRIKEFAHYSSQLLTGTTIKLAIENTGIYDLEFIKSAIHELLKEDHIVLTWDIGHDHSSGYRDHTILLENKEKIKHIHIHDAMGEKNHLPLRKGEVNFDEVMGIASCNNCMCVIETKTIQGLKDSVEELSSL